MTIILKNALAQLTQQSFPLSFSLESGTCYCGNLFFSSQGEVKVSSKIQTWCTRVISMLEIFNIWSVLKWSSASARDSWLITLSNFLSFSLCQKACNEISCRKLMHSLSLYGFCSGVFVKKRNDSLSANVKITMMSPWN